MTHDDPVTEMDLLAYVDGHLDPVRQRFVEAWLAQHPRSARRVAQDRELNAAIRALYEPVMAQLPPARLRALLRQRPQPRLWPRFAAMACFGLAAGAGYFAGLAQPPKPDYPVVRQFAMGDLMPVDLAGHQPMEWLSERLRASGEPPDLSDIGFELVAQDFVGDAQRPAVQLTYANETGAHIELFLQTRWRPEETAFQFAESNGLGLLYWTNGPLIFAMTGDIPPEELNGLAGQIAAQSGAAPKPAAKPAPVAVKPTTPVLPVSEN